MLRGLLVALLLLALPAPAHALRLVEVGRFREPVYVTGAGDRVLVVERRGLIRDLRRRVFADLRPLVVRPQGNETVDQRGLLSIAVRGRRFYAMYAARDGRLRVDEFPGGRHVLDLGPAALQHHGGQLQFGPDGLLYVSTGIGDDPVTPGQILRLDPRASAPPEVYATGLRNPWRFSFHRGALLIGDVGETTTEEVNVMPRGAPPGMDFGWPSSEGVGAALMRSHDSGWCAIVGGYVYRGRYVYGDLCSGRLRSARLSGRALVDDRPLRVRVPYLTSFGRAGGRLYAVSFFGSVYRFSAGARRR
jgi:hypothetical protein